MWFKNRIDDEMFPEHILRVKENSQGSSNAVFADGTVALWATNKLGQQILESRPNSRLAEVSHCY